MTTSTNNDDESRTGVRKRSWEDDVSVDIKVERRYTGSGMKRINHCRIADSTFEDGWIRSNNSQNLSNMN